MTRTLTLAVGGTVMMAAVALSAPPAKAILFSVSGTAASDGRPENATADFSFNAANTVLTIVLTNTAGAGQLGGITSVLDGIGWTMSQTPTSMTLAGVSSANGTVDCTGLSCAFTGGVATDNTTFFKWGLGAGTLSDPLLAAGNGSYKPFGIVNNNITHTDGIPNTQHNDYLNGPVTFTINLTGLMGTPDITGARFFFGTVPDTLTSGPNPPPPPVSEPGTVLLLGSGLSGLVVLRRMRSRDS